MSKNMGYNIAVVGATGNVGRKIIEILHERNFPVSQITALASRESKGKHISFGKQILSVEILDDFDFNGVDLVLSSPGSAVSARFAPKAAAAGAIVIDNTSQFRMDSDVPLVVPEVNSEALQHFANRNIIANPNCNVIPIAVALKPLHDIAPIKRIVVSTYQSVSGAGKKAMDELFFQTKGKYMNETNKPIMFDKPIAFNVIPQIGDFDYNGNTSEEVKTVQELQKILSPDIAVSATCVRVPVFVGHAASINVEFSSAMDASTAREILYEQDNKGVLLVDSWDESSDDSNYITPIDCAGYDAVYVSRVRNDNSKKNTLNMWVVSDNLRKGAALNAVQIAEELINNYL